jgi:hypothetical protein
MTHFHGGRSASLVSLGSLVGVAALGVRECKKTSIVVYFPFSMILRLDGRLILY